VKEEIMVMWHDGGNMPLVYKFKSWDEFQDRFRLKPEELSELQDYGETSGSGDMLWTLDSLEDLLAEQ
jgi:hypothetical protein